MDTLAVKVNGVPNHDSPFFDEGDSRNDVYDGSSLNEKRQSFIWFII
ncbi:MAG: hypothetical protein P8N57_00815 [Flavobacteriaceae bacterium]|nr:hypothetical protein [Flavobacteriaceae bacterium]